MPGVWRHRTPLLPVGRWCAHEWVPRRVAPGIPVSSAPADAGRMILSSELLISADSHVLEPADLWTEGLPAPLRDRAPRVYFDAAAAGWMFGGEDVPPQPIASTFLAGVDFERLPETHRAGYQAARPGGWDPHARPADMALDGVTAEVLYPSLGLLLYWMRDAQLQESCFRTYNDWLIDYCAAWPDRLVGIAMISLWDVDHALLELRRSRELGLRGAMIWLTPPGGHGFSAPHLDPFWATAAELDMPISLHILTDHGASRRRVFGDLQGLELSRVNLDMTIEIEQAFFELIFGGVLERHPLLKVVSVENEYHWLASLLCLLDQTWERLRRVDPPPIRMWPSDYYRRQMACTFLNDPVGPLTIPYVGVDTLMWSNDYPHQNSTWPHSRQVIARDLGHLPVESRAKLLHANVARLYGLTVPPPVGPG